MLNYHAIISRRHFKGEFMFLFHIAYGIELIALAMGIA